MEGKAAKSTSGAAMSKYDVEVEGRLKLLEAAVKEIKAQLSDHKHDTPVSSGGGDVEAKLDDLIAKLGRKMSI